VSESKDTYFTVNEEYRAEISVKSSRFIATCVPVTTRESALERLAHIRSEFFDATHNCYAYRLGIGGLDFRFSDDGEPNSTAGKPILFMMQKYEVSDVLLIVTRYYGGTKLGVGGLSRAYSDAAEQVLKLCNKKPVYKTTKVRVMCMYEDIGVVKSLLETYAVSHEADYRDIIEIYCDIPCSLIDEFCNAVTQKTHARAGTFIEQIQ
jgi:uncharacterized YigZ family protein